MNAPDRAGARPTGLTRRRLMQLGLVAAAGTALGAGSSALLTHLGRSTRPRYRFFGDEDAGLLIAVCERIIPGDDTPGATEAGVIQYIDRQLVGVYQEHQPTYRRGLAALRETCRAFGDTPFPELPEAKQIEILELLESGRPPGPVWEAPSSSAFFSLILKHTMEGFYGSPRHGGNRGYASYRMLDLDYPQIIGRNRPSPSRT
jgi:gluconate 2-dehydrogenase gamma chain